MNVQNIITIADAAIEGIKAFKESLLSSASDSPAPSSEVLELSVESSEDSGRTTLFPEEIRPIKARKTASYYQWRGEAISTSVLARVIQKFCSSHPRITATLLRKDLESEYGVKLLQTKTGDHHYFVQPKEVERLNAKYQFLSPNYKNKFI